MRAWCARAGDAGSVQALYNYADLAKQRGDHATAEDRYRTAAEAGHLNALDHVLESARSRGDQAEIEHWRQRRRIATEESKKALARQLAEEAASTWSRSWTTSSPTTRPSEIPGRRRLDE